MSSTAELDRPAAAFDPGWRMDARFRTLPPDFYTLMPAERVGGDPILLHANAKAADLLDLDPAVFADPAFAAAVTGHVPMAGFEPLAMVYSGHQFGHWAGQLGDGRALLVAQVRNSRRELWDVQLKGAGMTPYSRMGDGRAVLRSSIREYLCSEAMAALGIPTTRALALTATREGVRREQVEPGAVLTRLSPSHIRFGHFEHFHHNGRPELVALLADHVIAEHFPDLAGRADRHEAWFRAVVARTADLIASWQAVGFAHGVMNTDNMSILGLTMDYGPFGFHDGFDPGFICNHSDHGGRYAFDRQPSVAHWNLHALAIALSSLLPVPVLKDALAAYPRLFGDSFDRRMAAKLGLASPLPDDQALVADLLALMARARADYTLTFRDLAAVDGEGGTERWLGRFALFAEGDAARWLGRYRARLAVEPDPNRPAAMNAVNPKYVLRNWVAETVIQAVQREGDFAALDRVLTVLQSPFGEHPQAAHLAAPPPPHLADLCVSCSS